MQRYKPTHDMATPRSASDARARLPPSDAEQVNCTVVSLQLGVYFSPV